MKCNSAFITKLKEWHWRRQGQDIEATIEILQKGDLHAKLISFLCFWYPWRGSVQDHIAYLKTKLSR